MSIKCVVVGDGTGNDFILKLYFINFIVNLLSFQIFKILFGKYIF